MTRTEPQLKPKAAESWTTTDPRSGRATALIAHRTCRLSVLVRLTVKLMRQPGGLRPDVGIRLAVRRDPTSPPSHAAIWRRLLLCWLHALSTGQEHSIGHVMEITAMLVRSELTESEDASHGGCRSLDTPRDGVCPRPHLRRLAYLWQSKS